MRQIALLTKILKTSIVVLVTRDLLPVEFDAGG